MAKKLQKFYRKHFLMRLFLNRFILSVYSSKRWYSYIDLIFQFIFMQNYWIYIIQQWTWSMYISFDILCNLIFFFTDVVKIKQRLAVELDLTIYNVVIFYDKSIRWFFLIETLMSQVWPRVWHKCRLTR